MSKITSASFRREANFAFTEASRATDDNTKKAYESYGRVMQNAADVIGDLERKVELLKQEVEDLRLENGRTHGPHIGGL